MGADDAADAAAPCAGRASSLSVGSSGKLPLKVKVLLGIGESVQGIYVVVGGYYLNSFLLETACIDPMYVGLMQAIQGVFDALNDPFIGSLSDRTRTRWGRRRPWLLFTAPILAAFYFGLWNALPNIVPQFWKFVFALAMYMGVSVGITSIQVQIGALVPELTEDYDERTSVSAWRIGTMSVVGLAAAVIHNLIVSADGIGGQANGFRLSAIVLAVCMWASSWITFGGIHEKWKPKQESSHRMGCKESFCTLIRNKAFMCVAGAYLCGPTSVVLIQTNLFMYCKYILGDADILTIIMPCVQGLGLVFLPVWVLLGRWFDKRTVFMMGGSGFMVAMICIFFLTEPWQAISVSCVCGMCVSTVYLVPYSMLPDVIDEDELRTGKRREGLYVGFFTTMLKFSATTSLTLTNWMLKLMGYVAPVASCGIDVADLDDCSEDTIQSEGVLITIRLLCSFFPAFFVFLAVILVWAFPITRQKQKAMSTLAAQARVERAHQASESGQPQNPHSPRQIKALNDFINDSNNHTEEAILDEMQKSYADARFQEYSRAHEYDRRSPPVKVEPMSVEVGKEPVGSRSDRESTTDPGASFAAVEPAQTEGGTGCGSLHPSDEAMSQRSIEQAI